MITTVVNMSIVQKCFFLFLLNRKSTILDVKIISLNNTANNPKNNLQNF